MVNPNSVRIENDLIVLVIHGKQTFDIADKTYKSVRSKIQRLKLQKKPVHILVDMSDVAGHDAAARSRVKDFFALDYSKMAYFGAASYAQNLILYLAGPRNDRVRMFKNKDVAVAWLTDGKEPLFSIKEPNPRSSKLLLLLTFLVGVIITCGVCAKLYESSVTVSHRQAVRATIDASDATVAKINAYLTALYGYRSFYAASDTINQSNFHSFFTGLELQSRLPGITAIAYIRQVPAEDKQAVIDEIRSDTSLPDTPLAEFTIKSPQEEPTYYPIVYLEPLPAESETYGLDLNTYPGRVASLIKAQKTGRPVVSDSFEMMRGGKAMKQKGFIISIPVTGGSSPNQTGYINAIFDYNDLFANTRPLVAGHFEITDNSHRAIFTSAGVQPTESRLATHDMQIGDKTWQLALYGNYNYGLSHFEYLTPWVALVIGLAITALVVLVLNNILRSRQSAFELAHYITEDLRVAEHTHDLMIDSVEDYAIYMLDKDGKVMTWNSGAALIHGYKANEILGKPCTIFHRPGDRRTAHRILKQAAAEGRAEEYGWRIRKDKSEFWAHVTLSTIHDKEGELLGFTKLTQDLTRERQLEQERDNFLAIATHELKTPITSIKAYAQVLQRRFTKAGDDRSAELLGRMDTQANKLTMLVSDLLDVSKIETGRLEYEKKAFDLDAVVENVAEEVGRTSTKHDVTVSGKIDRPVIGDEYRIGQLITNLIENAIKYSPDSARVAVSLRTYKQFAELRVRDFGPGISLKEQPLIFDRFYRVASENQSPGFGLGLYISSEIARNHGGTLTVRSTPGKGATFTLRLPLGGIDD